MEWNRVRRAGNGDRWNAAGDRNAAGKRNVAGDRISVRGEGEGSTDDG